MGTMEILVSGAAVASSLTVVATFIRKWSKDSKAETRDQFVQANHRAERSEERLTKQLEAARKQNHDEHMQTSGKIDEVNKTVHRVDRRLDTIDGRVIALDHRMGTHEQNHREG